MKKLSDGCTMPVLGLGTWQLTGEDCERAVEEALELGYRHIDTAQIYHNHGAIGRAIKKSGVPREELFITTKVWRTNLAPKDVRAAVEEALSELQTDYVDLLLVHWPNSQVPIKQTLEAFKGLRDEGKVRSMGVSNFTIEHLKEAFEAGVPIVNNQVEFHAKLYQKELKVFCDEHDIILTAYSPLGHGSLLDDPSLKAIADKHGVSVPQVELAWLKQKGLCAIPKASSKEHMKDNIGALELKLDEEDIERIDSMDQNKRYIEPGFAEFGRMKT